MANRKHRPRAYKVRVSGVLFHFAYDDEEPTLLHIFARHLKEPKHAIAAWFQGQHVWREEHRRFEGQAGRLGILWFWLDYERAAVQVISCFDS
jgi:hypothetical protein